MSTNVDCLLRGMRHVPGVLLKWELSLGNGVEALQVWHLFLGYKAGNISTR